MNFRNRVLVVVNRRAERQLALDRAAELAKATGAELRLQAVAYEPELSGRIFYWDDDEQAAAREARLDSTVTWLEERAAKLDLPRVSMNADWGHPFDRVVLSAVSDYAPDVLIVQPRGGVGARLSLTEWRLLSQCPVPVWLARAANWNIPPKVVAAVDPSGAEDKPASLDADIVAAAASVGRAFGTDFGVLHSIDEIPSAIGIAQAPEDYERELRAIRTRRIKKLLPADSSDRVAITVSSLEPAQALREHCAEHKVDLMAMGMLARSRLADALIGSTARQFVPRSECDVLLIKPLQR